MTTLNESSMKKGINNPQPSQAGTSTVVSFLKDLDKIQEQQIIYSKRVQKEKMRKTQLEEDIKVMRQEIFNLKARTRDGQAFKDEEAAARKTIARLEKKVQMSKIQLSVAHAENGELKRGIDAMRLNKTMYLQIRNDMVHELEETKQKIIVSQKENADLNNKKLKAKSDKINIKNQMVSDMEEFSRELQAAKENISSNQETIIETIREKMNSLTVDEWDSFDLYNKQSPKKSKNKSEFTESLAQTISHSDEDEIRALLDATKLDSVEALLANMQQCEDSIFSMYKNIQLSGEELEKLELENKSLENQAEEQVQKLQAVEGHNDKVREDLEQHIGVIQKSVTFYENGYNSNLGVLQAIVESLTSILKNVALDEDVASQQLLSQGVNDRNIEAYLGVVEQRIDDLIQISKAAKRENFSGTDFHAPIAEKKPVVLNVPHLPTLHVVEHDENEDVDDDSSGFNKVQPINIQLLKEFMQKKVQRGLNEKKASNISPQSLSNFA